VHALRLEAVGKLRPDQEAVQLGQRARLVLHQAYQEARRAGLEPPGPEFLFITEQQDVEGVVDALRSPVVAVVPGLDGFSWVLGDQWCEPVVHVLLGVAADGVVAGVQGQVVQLVQTREHPGLAELAYPGQEYEAQVGIGILENAVQAPQLRAYGIGAFQIGQSVQDGLVVFVDQYHRRGPMVFAGQLDQFHKRQRWQPLLQGTRVHLPHGCIQLVQDARLSSSRLR
jgi:hypothetical protein